MNRYLCLIFFWCGFLVVVSCKNKESIHQESTHPVGVETDFIKKMQGSWRLVGSGTNWGYRDLSLEETEELITIKKNEISYFERDKSDGTKSLISRENIFLYHGSIGHLYPIKWITKEKIIIGFEFDSDENLLFRQLGELSEDGTEMEQVCGNLEKVYERIK